MWFNLNNIVNYQPNELSFCIYNYLSFFTAYYHIIFNSDYCLYKNIA